MKIGIHHIKGSFSERWIIYCNTNNIEYKLVDCYKSYIIDQLSDCDALMWHFSQNNPKAMLFAKQLLYSVEAAGKKVFPDFHTVWHFDDKLGQKYLLEAIGAPLVPVWVFYDKAEALEWINLTTFPKVFKLSRGAGSQNVRLIKTKRDAEKLVRRAFSKGFPAYYALGSIKERWRKYRLGRTDFRDLAEGVLRFAIPPPYSRRTGYARDYIYFQEFIPGNNFDIRIIVVGDKAFGIKRMVRNGDFRASGSGMILYEKENFDDQTVRLAFLMAEKLNSQCAAFDFIYSGTNIYVVELSYGFAKEGYDACLGYWDKELQWYAGHFNPYGWMVDNLIKKIDY